MTVRTGGIGSNQYGSKPGGTVRSRSGAPSAAQVAAAVTDEEVEEIGWAFENPAWSAAGWNREDSGSWSAYGFTPEDAREWLDNGFDSGDAARWRDKEFAPTDAADWVNDGWGAEDAADWYRKDFEPWRANEWMAAGVDDASTAAEMRSDGFEPGITPQDEIDAYLAGGDTD